MKAVVKIPEEQIFLKVSKPEPGESESINFPESIAVVAESNWQAMKAMEKLSPKFLGGNSEEVSDAEIEKLFSRALDYLENVFIEDVKNIMIADDNGTAWRTYRAAWSSMNSVDVYENDLNLIKLILWHLVRFFLLLLQICLGQ